MKIYNFILIFILTLFCNLKAQNLTLSGLDALKEEKFESLKNKNIALITNHTAIDRNGVSILDNFKTYKVNLKAIFSPEHGFTGQAEGGLYIENSTASGQIPIYSLYGKNKRPTEEMLKDIDTMVFDIQDIGARFYTYLTTMGYAMEEAAKHNIEFIVLDRPNPIGLNLIEGPILSDKINKFTAYFKVPIRHGLTAGEMALFHKNKMNLNLNLKIVKVKNYTRDMIFDETGLIWINPSPNIRSLNAAILYPGIGCFEATNVSVGRGTDNPFLWIGAPWMKANKIVKKLNKLNLKGVKFSYKEKTPNADIYKNELCKGIEIKVENKKEVKAVDIFVYLSYFLRKFNGHDFIIKKDEIEAMTGTGDFYEMLNSNKKPEEIINFFNNSNKDFINNLKQKNIILYN